jgi:hypothetical protein
MAASIPQAFLGLGPRQRLAAMTCTGAPGPALGEAQVEA